MSPNQFRFAVSTLVTTAVLLASITGCGQGDANNTPAEEKPATETHTRPEAGGSSESEASEPAESTEATAPSTETSANDAKESGPPEPLSPEAQLDALTDDDGLTEEERAKAEITEQIYRRIQAMKAEQNNPNTLKSELDAIAAQSAERISEDKRAIMTAGTQELADSGILDKIIKVDDKAPDFELPSTAGGTQKLSDLLAKGPVVMTFYRGGWCPYCNATLKAYDKHRIDIEASGASLIAITPEVPKKAAQTAGRNKIDFPVLSDVGNKVAEEYGLVFKLNPELAELYTQFLDIVEYNGDNSNTLPLSATYVIAPDGTVRYVFADPDYRKRAEPSDLIAAILQMKLQ